MKRAPKDGPAKTRDDGTTYTVRAAGWQSDRSTQMPGVMPRTGGRVAGEGGHTPTGAVEAATAQDRWSRIPGEPDALKGACPVREEAVGNGSIRLSKGN
jgi:hypothetical protein